MFTLDELWLLQAYVRHEVAQQPGWRFPPASLDLNDAVADGLLVCLENGLTEAAVLLTRADCLAIDTCVPQNAKSAAGAAVGRSVLVKSYQARRSLAGGPIATATEPPLAAADLSTRLRDWEKQGGG